MDVLFVGFFVNVLFCLLSVFVILVSVICYGLIFFPVFGALTVRTPLGYILGTLHVWVFFFEASFITFGCSDLLSSVSTLVKWL